MPSGPEVPQEEEGRGTTDHTDRTWKNINRHVEEVEEEEGRGTTTNRRFAGTKGTKVFIRELFFFPAFFSFLCVLRVRRRLTTNKNSEQSKIGFLHSVLCSLLSVLCYLLPEPGVRHHGVCGRSKTRYLVPVVSLYNSCYSCLMDVEIIFVPSMRWLCGPACLSNSGARRKP
jgi:hypothetical protein